MKNLNEPFLSLIDRKFSSILEMCEETCDIAGLNKFDYRVVLTAEGHIERICSTRGISDDELDGLAIVIHQFKKFDLNYLAHQRFEEMFMQHFKDSRHCVEYVTWLNARYPNMDILNCDFSLSTAAQNIVLFEEWHPDLFEMYLAEHKAWIIRQECWQVEMKLLDLLYGISSTEESIVMMLNSYDDQVSVA